MINIRGFYMLLSKPGPLLALFFLAGFILLGSINAGAEKDSLHLNIYGPGQKKLNILLAPPQSLNNNTLSSPERAGELKSIFQENLSYLFFLKQVQKQELLGEKTINWIDSGDIDFKRLRMSDVDLVMTMGWRTGDSGEAQVELRVYEVFTQDLLVGRGYIINNREQIIQAANRFCSGIMEQLTGRSGFFSMTV